MLLVAENKTGLRRNSPYVKNSIHQSSGNSERSGGCYYDYGAPKRASFSYYEKGGKSGFIESIKRQEEGHK